MNKYVFGPYDPNFPKLFKREKEKLDKILGKNAKIEHVGSTAVSGLGGKGIIDIAISVSKNNIEKAKKILQENNYEFRPEGGNKERLFFRKDYKDSEKTRRVHIHLTFHDSFTWKSNIAVRDYLRQHHEEARKYGEIKRKAAKLCEGEKEVYMKEKEPFLSKVEKKAMKL